MIVNDVFTTHGSANIIPAVCRWTEMNIAHEWGSVTRDLRRRLGLYTSGKGVQDNASDAFDAWEYIISKIKNASKTIETYCPCAFIMPTTNSGSGLMRQLILFLSLMACLLHSASSAKGLIGILFPILTPPRRLPAHIR